MSRGSVQKRKGREKGIYQNCVRNKEGKGMRGLALRDGILDSFSFAGNPWMDVWMLLLLLMVKASATMLQLDRKGRCIWEICADPTLSRRFLICLPYYLCLEQMARGGNGEMVVGAGRLQQRKQFSARSWISPVISTLAAVSSWLQPPG
jgi:hypothetical protein